MTEFQPNDTPRTSTDDESDPNAYHHEYLILPQAQIFASVCLLSL